MTIREIIAAAMRRGKTLASGETPSADEERDVLARLQSLVLEHPGLSGARWRDVYAASSATITARDGDRITVGAFSPVIVKPTVETWCITRRNMPPLSRIYVMDGSDAGLFLFSSEWRRADALTLDDLNPFGADTDNGLIAQLAVTIADDFGGEIGAKTALEAQRSERTIRGRLYRDRDCPRELPCDYI